MPLLTLLVVLPLIGAGLLFVTRRGHDRLVRQIALGVSLLNTKARTPISADTHTNTRAGTSNAVMGMPQGSRLATRF